MSTVTAGTNATATQFNDSVLAENYIINGNFDIWQRGASFTPANGDYMADRWRSSYNADSGTLPTDTISRQALTSGELNKSFYYLRLSVNGAGSGFGANAEYAVAQRIEHGTRLLCGDLKKVTISFYAKSDISGKKLGIWLQQTYGSGGSPSSAEVLTGDTWTLTSSWTKYTYTFTTNTLSAKTFGSNSDDYLQVLFYYMWGSNNASKVGESASESFVGSGNIDIAQVQVNTGETALEFKPRLLGEELQMCQRYYEKSFPFGFTPGISSSGNGNLSKLSNHGSIAGSLLIPFKVTKRTTPTITTWNNSTSISSSTVGYYHISFVGDQTNGTITNIGDSSFLFIFGTSSANDKWFQWEASAEL